MSVGVSGLLSVEANQMEANLVLLKKNGSHKTIPLPSSVTVIGRRHGCDLLIQLPTISRRHCEITQNGEFLKVRDLDSTWGTFVNGQRVKGEKPIKAGDSVRIGPLTFVCQIGGKPEKITPPRQAKPQAKPKDALADTAPDGLTEGLEDSFADLDASDSVIAFDESDSDMEDLSTV
jgi:pSer/pThr/pTyr-binding forkhead associated (FHA) protein